MQDDLVLGKKLGEGGFGTVYRATFANPKEAVSVFNCTDGQNYASLFSGKLVYFASGVSLLLLFCRAKSLLLKEP